MRSAVPLLFALLLFLCFSYAMVQATEREQRIRASVLDALDFLAERQSLDGSWRDFYMPPLHSTADEWVTAYVALAVSKAKEKGFSTPASDEALRKALDFLKATKRPDGGWAYGRAWNQSDADSTAFAVRVLHREAPDFDLTDSIALLKAHEKNGGYSTYVEPPYFLRECGAWCEAVPDVSASVAIGLKEARTEFTETTTVQHLLSQQRREGYWQAYWWPDKFY
ncbi:MAG: prenyltransferase/squalene oxidase repeat-containing protein, partial [Candidatus Micrarchaeota archaeon]